ncbi:sialate O-acetylesterase [Desertivirga arenae]|uniref:sialate O-acetylesterase n=1 Tax=Desertivirga arenae TaxID=2810309 RepID=UPI001A973BFE|nr:sialate O-acetylesterase [Pedobacter sp. SYSU D00823]
MYKYRFLFSCLCLLNISTVFANVRLPAVFADNMVLQQKSRVKIWGTSSENETVRIRTSWDNKKYSVRSGLSWQIMVNTPAAGGPFEIEITGRNKIIFKNVLIGEVWLCSGQSNMEMPVKGFYNSPVLNSNDLLLQSPNSKIRLFRIERKAAAEPQQDVKGTWEEAAPESVSEFSAVAYQFAVLLNKNLSVPVGLIQSAWGGSPIEAWMEDKSFAQLSKENKLTGGATSQKIHHIPSHLFNGMIAPIVGYNIAGALWYQGEQNRYNYQDYSLLQPAMVKSWRSLWNQGAWPFFYVQIAPMHYPENQKHLLPFLREVQLKLEDQIPNSGMAVSIDGGEEHNIHPANKEIISKRLAFLALSKKYGQPALGYSAPKYKSIQISKDTVIVHFSNASMGIASMGKDITQFEIAGKDRKFYKAEARIKGADVLVYSTRVSSPEAVRYAFSDWAIGELYGVNGLPVSSFRSDDW